MPEVYKMTDKEWNSYSFLKNLLDHLEYTKRHQNTPHDGLWISSEMCQDIAKQLRLVLKELEDA